MNPIATQSAQGLKVADNYTGRVEVNTNGFLTLKGLKSEDSGDYSLNLVTLDGTSSSAEIKLNVLGESFQ